MQMHWTQESKAKLARYLALFPCESLMKPLYTYGEEENIALGFFSIDSDAFSKDKFFFHFLGIFSHGKGDVQARQVF